MLPFLKNSKEAGAQTPVDPIKRKPDDGSDDDMDSLSTVMGELSTALKAGDHGAAAEAFRAALDICLSEPHEETGE